jgi:hypothetical protein
MHSEIAIVNSYANVKKSRPFLGNQHNDVQEKTGNPAKRAGNIAGKDCCHILRLCHARTGGNVRHRNREKIGFLAEGEGLLQKGKGLFLKTQYEAKPVTNETKRIRIFRKPARPPEIHA